MQDVNTFKLGLFTLSAIILFILGITFMGIFDGFMPKARVTTIVNESVQGLSNGSAVKYKGVPIGTITDILILTSTGQIQINFEIDLSRFRRKLSDGKGKGYITTQKQFYAYLLARVHKGLTCRIEPDGITGSKYIEMDFFHERKAVLPTHLTCIRQGLFYLPSTPSMMSNLRMNALEILASIASVDFKGISEQLNMLLTVANDTLQKAHLQDLVVKANRVTEKLTVTVDQLNKTTDPGNLGRLMQNLDTTICSVNDLSRDIQETVKASSVPAVASDIRLLAKSLEESNRTLQQSLQKANETLDAMTDLIRYLNENPSSMIRGRGKQTDPFEKENSGRQNK
jgi:ABC-type transporter Mla subunit MlaD